jgi:8-oxo-dGTP pyrophosphatase MutT (NUDIX family)
MTDSPQFGKAVAEGAVPRRAVYALVRDGRGWFLAVRGPGGSLFLPGGGCESEESSEEALARELREETGRELVSFACRSTAVQHFAADGVSYHMTAEFYDAVLGDQVAEPEEKLLWVDPARGDDLWHHACHAWAVRNEAGGASI